MDKYHLSDLFAALVCGVLGFLMGFVFYLVNPYISFFVYVIIGFIASLSSFLIYVFLIRKTDKQIDLEISLAKIAELSKEIAEVANNLERFPNQKKMIGEISRKVAWLGNKCIRRELLPLEVQIGHLKRISSNFLSVLPILTGEVRLSNVKMEQELDQIVNEHIPKTLVALEQLEIKIDESEARKLARKEADLEVLTALYEGHNKAQETIRLLNDLMTQTY